MTGMPVEKMIVKPCLCLLLLPALIFLSGCATVHSDTAAMALGSQSLAGIDQEIPAEKITSEPLQLAAQGIKLVGENRLAEASEQFNLALKLDPTSSYLHFLNALTYHLRSIKGDGSFFELARQGYELALKFDQTNWLASYQMGLLQLDRRNFAEAQNWFADALLYNSKDADLLYSMVAASYYARDPRTAAAVLSRLQKLEPDSERVLRAAAFIMAALDHPEAARDYMAQFQDAAPVSQPEQLAVRLADWQNFYERNGRIILQQSTTDLDLRPGTSPTLLLASSNSADVQDNGQESWPEEEEEQNIEAEEPDEYQMAIVDVVIIRTEENLTTRKGVNLLNGLTMQFGPNSFENLNTRYKDRLAETLTTKESTETVINGFSIPALSYSMNIFNTNTDRNEILARPTLVALNGEQSEFFTGTKLRAAAVATSAAGGESVEIEEEIGVKLVITPVFLDDGRIKLAVEAERTFLKTPSSDVTFQFKLEMTQTKVNSNVVMNFGETLILSGLSEKETERQRDGVPVLQDLPGVQYLFSRKDTRDFQKSVLILITPRSSQYIYHERGQGDGVAGLADGTSGKELNELQARYSDWFKPYPNWASVFHHFQSNSLYREFRTGDVTMEHWENQQNLFSRLRDALGYLYY